MQLRVALEIVQSAELGVASRARKGFLVRMSEQMRLEVMVSGEGLRAVRTGVLRHRAYDGWRRGRPRLSHCLYHTHPSIGRPFELSCDRLSSLNGGEGSKQKSGRCSGSAAGGCALASLVWLKWRNCHTHQPLALLNYIITQTPSICKNE